MGEDALIGAEMKGETMKNDLISRQDAIEAVNKNRDSVFHNSVNHEGALYDISNLPSSQPESRWIPVTERLPKPYSGEYLVTINDGSVYTDILWFDSPGDGRYESCFYKTDNDGYGVVCEDVTAWMPLPKPWKGEEDAEAY